MAIYSRLLVHLHSCSYRSKFSIPTSLWNSQSIENSERQVLSTKQVPVRTARLTSYHDQLYLPIIASKIIIALHSITHNIRHPRFPHLTFQKCPKVIMKERIETISNIRQQQHLLETSIQHSPPTPSKPHNTPPTFNQRIYASISNPSKLTNLASLGILPHYLRWGRIAG